MKEASTLTRILEELWVTVMACQKELNSVVARVHPSDKKKLAALKSVYGKLVEIEGACIDIDTFLEEKEEE